MQQRNANNARIIDVSNNNGPINWSQVKASGIVGAWAKATEGATGRDSFFYQNYIGMKNAGVLRGAYCFARPATSSPLDEANALVDRVLAAGGFDGSLDPVLDLEDAGGRSPDYLATFILTFADRVKVRTGRDIILYTYPAFITEHLAPVVGRINHLRLWLANYSSWVPELPGWNRWTILQYSETGRVPGINGHVDLDEFDGTAEQFAIVCGAKKSGGITLTEEQVKVIQSGLVSVLKLPVNPKTWIDGQYGPATAAAMKSFQYMKKLPVTGQADATSVAALNSAVAALPKTPTAPVPAQPKPVEASPAPSTTIETVTADKKAQLASLVGQLADAIKAL